MSIILTDDLQVIPPVRRGATRNPNQLTIGWVPSAGSPYISLPRAAVEHHGWESATHVLIKANRKDFVLQLLTNEKPGAHRLNSLTSQGRTISVGALADALGIQKGERFTVDFEYDGKLVYASWPDELRERMAGVTRIRGAA